MIRAITSDKKVLIASQCEEATTRKLSRSNELYCPNCNQLARYNKGSKKVYFSHQPNATCIVTDYERETEQHIKGKDILYKWLKMEFPDATVMPEVYIKETNQIADILVTHTSGELKGNKWAFEFQHSSLSSDKWKERHQLYQSAGILDFWVFDENVFLLFSRSENEDLKESRRQKDPTETVFNTTGFCYFLNLEEVHMTIDYHFRYEDYKYKHYLPAQEYKFHAPSEHSYPLSNVKLKYIKKHNFGALHPADPDKNYKIRFNGIVAKLQRRAESRWLKEYEKQKTTKVLYGEKIFGKYLNFFIEENYNKIKDDVYHASNEDFFNKYKNYFEKSAIYEIEKDAWKEKQTIVGEIFNKLPYATKWKERFTMEFLDKYESLEHYIITEHSSAIDIVNYVLDKHDTTLEKMINYRFGRENLHDKLREISRGISTYGLEAPYTKLDYAALYYKYETEEEIDVVFAKIGNIVNGPDPFLIDMEDLDLF